MVIDENIEITIIDVRGKSVNLGIDAICEISICRKEMVSHKQAEPVEMDKTTG